MSFNADSLSVSEPERIELPWFRRKSPHVQILLASACLFCNPGINLAITGLGAGGGRGAASIYMFDISSGVLYGMFTFSAIFGGCFINFLGPRTSMLIGNTGYPFYIGALWYFEKTGHLWFPIFGGLYLGFTAGLLWSTAGFTAMTYPEEVEKGRWRAIQWTFLALGAVIGAIVSLGVTLGQTATESVPEAVYIIFIVIQLSSAFFAVLLCDPNEVIRNDCSPVASFKQANFWETFSGLIEALSDWRLLIMIPCFFAAEVFLVYQSSFNAFVFTTRTRNLNNVLVNVFQIPFSIATGYLLDNKNLGSRRRRGLIVATLMAIWVGGANIAEVVWVAKWKLDRSTTGPQIDWSDHAYAGAVSIHLAYGAQYGMFQNTGFWILAAMTNKPGRLAHMSGFAVGFLSAGTATAFGIDAAGTPYLNEICAYFALFVISVPILLFNANHATESNYFMEDGVGVPVHVQLEKRHIVGREVVRIDCNPSTEDQPGKTAEA